MRVTSLSTYHIPGVIALLRDAAEQGAFRGDKMDEQHVRDVLMQFIYDNERTRVCVLALSHDQQIVGVLAVGLNTYYYRPGLLAEEVVYYVHSGWRGSRAALSLLQTATQWAIDKGADKLIVSVSDPQPPMPAERIYQRVGFSKFGTLWHKDIKDVSRT